MGTEEDLRRIAALAQTAADQAARGANVGLGVLLAEMQALSAVLPGMVHAQPKDAAKEDAEVEAGFDNMPV
ncbi:MAG: hypothetical protein ACK4MS_12040 [Paracoccaceae bacterium]